MSFPEVAMIAVIIVGIASFGATMRWLRRPLPRVPSGESKSPPRAHGKRPFRFGLRLRRLLAAYHRPAGFEAKAIKAAGDHRRADRTQRGSHICISSRYSRLVIALSRAGRKTEPSS